MKYFEEELRLDYLFLKIFVVIEVFIFFNIKNFWVLCGLEGEEIYCVVLFCEYNVGIIFKRIL